MKAADRLRITSAMLGVLGQSTSQTPAFMPNFRLLKPTPTGFRDRPQRNRVPVKHQDRSKYTGAHIQFLTAQRGISPKSVARYNKRSEAASDG